MNKGQLVDCKRGGEAISELTGLFARLEAALAAIETRCAAEAASGAADRARLERIEQAAAQAIRALDDLIGQE